MRFRDVRDPVEYAKLNPVKTTIALGTTGAVALGAATSLREILHLRYISYLLPLTHKPKSFDLSNMKTGTKEYLLKNNVRFTSVTVTTQELLNVGWYVKFRVEVEGLAAAKVAQRSIEKCLATGNAEPLFGTAKHLFDSSRPASTVRHGHGNIRDLEFSFSTKIECRTILDNLNAIMRANFHLPIAEVGFILNQLKFSRYVFNVNINSAEQCQDYNTRKVRVQVCRQFYSHVLEELELIIAELEEKYQEDLTFLETDVIRFQAFLERTIN